jgi:hypothetical protein
MLEVADGVALDLLGAEEGNCCLGRHSGGSHWLGCSDDDKPITFGLPGKVNNGVLDRVDHLDGDALLPDAENLERSSHRLLGLGVPVDLDADV